MNKNKPEIAILLASYNGGKYISEQLNSILRQTYPNIKIYIHDDGSKDDTLNQINAYSAKYPDKVIKIDGVSTGGACSNFIYLFRQVEANYYMCCDQDDVWLPDKVEITLHAMKSIEQSTKIPCLVHTDLCVVDANLNTIGKSMDRFQKLCSKDGSIQHIIAQNPVTGCTMMINRVLRDYLLQPFDEKSMIMHDWWLAIAAAQFGKIMYVDKATILYRQHGDNSVGAKKMNIGLLLKKIFPTERKKIRNSLLATQKQAKEFSEIYALDHDNLIYKYGHMEKMRKIKRIKLYIDCGIHKGSKSRTLGLYLWG